MQSSSSLVDRLAESDLFVTTSTRSASRTRSFILFSIVWALAAFAIALRGEQWLRSILIYLSRASWARTIVTNFPPAWAVASRFVAGESVDQAIAVARKLKGEGIDSTIDYLGEAVRTANEANDARDHILALLDEIHASGMDAYVSVKLSQLGLGIDENLALANLRLLLERARSHGLRLRIDMEESALTEITLDIYRKMRLSEGFANVGIVIQSSLYRSDDDLRRLIDEGAWVRIVKGAYKEPASVAYPAKADVDKAYVRHTQMLLGDAARKNGVRAAIATHDPAMIDAALGWVRQNHISPADFEFQMLYGIAREKQRELVAQGYRVRLYIPYGTAWYPYFMRRLAERPANLWFFVSALFRG
jgi:proline dehydrogenase